MVMGRMDDQMEKTVFMREHAGFLAGNLDFPAPLPELFHVNTQRLYYFAGVYIQVNGPVKIDVQPAAMRWIPLFLQQCLGPGPVRFPEQKIYIIHGT